MPLDKRYLSIVARRTKAKHSQRPRGWPFTDPVTQMMHKRGIPYTRENWIACAYLDNKPSPWGIEDELQVPVELRDWSQCDRRQLREAGFDPYEPRDKEGKWTKSGSVRPWPDVGWKPDDHEHPKFEVASMIENPEVEKALEMNERDIYARRELLRQGNENRAESVIYYGDNGTFRQIRGDLTHVSFSSEEQRQFHILDASGGENFTLHHNHPWDVAFSRPDLIGAAASRMKKEFVHCGSGSSYCVEQTSELHRAIQKGGQADYGILFSALDTAGDLVHNMILDRKFRSQSIEETEEFEKYVWRTTSHLMCLFLNDAGYFKYTYKLDPHYEAFFGPFIQECRKDKQWHKVAKTLHNMLRIRIF